MMTYLVLRRSLGGLTMIQGSGLHTIPLIFAQSSFGITASPTNSLDSDSSLVTPDAIFRWLFSLTLFFLAFQICTTSSIALPRRPARYAILAVVPRAKLYHKTFPVPLPAASKVTWSRRRRREELPTQRLLHSNNLKANFPLFLCLCDTFFNHKIIFASSSCEYLGERKIIRALVSDFDSTNPCVMTPRWRCYRLLLPLLPVISTGPNPAVFVCPWTRKFWCTRTLFLLTQVVGAAQSFQIFPLNHRGSVLGSSSLKTSTLYANKKKELPNFF